MTPALDGPTDDTPVGEGENLVPRWMVAVIVAILTILLAVDMLGQLVVPEHAANPIVDGALLTILGGVIAASRGPKPDPSPPSREARPDPLPDPDPVDPAPSDVPRRHRRVREEDPL